MNDLVATVARVRRSVVQVATAPAPGQAVRVGTGFFVAGDGSVLTAAHVVEETHDDPLLVGIPHPGAPTVRGSFTYLPARVVAADADRDLALLRPLRNPFDGLRSGVVVDGREVPLDIAVADLAVDRLPDGSPVAVAGYPVTEPVLVTTAGVVASAWAFDPTELPGEPAVVPVRDYYLLDITANPGNSGGPAYDAGSGQIIGVCVSFRVAAGAAEAGPRPVVFPYNSGLTVVTPIGALRPLLEAEVDPQA